MRTLLWLLVFTSYFALGHAYGQDQIDACFQADMKTIPVFEEGATNPYSEEIIEENYQVCIKINANSDDPSALNTFNAQNVKTGELEYNISSEETLVNQVLNSTFYVIGDFRIHFVSHITVLDEKGESHRDGALISVTQVAGAENMNSEPGVRELVVYKFKSTPEGFPRAP